MTLNHFYLLFYFSATTNLKNSRELGTYARIYSGLQLLLTLFNSMNQAGIMNVITVTIVFIQVIGLYVIITMYDAIDKVMLMIFLIGFVNSILCVFVMLGQASRVYPASVTAIKKFQKCIALSKSGRNGMLKKIVRHWRPMKVQFFSSNFFDQLTPLVIEHFCIDTTISLMILNT